jgi:hypothetical protein
MKVIKENCNTGCYIPYGLPLQQAGPTFAPPLGASISGGVATVDDPRHPPLRPSSVAGFPDLCAAPAASTIGIVATVDELLEPAATGSLLPHHDDGSSGGHQLGSRFRRR